MSLHFRGPVHLTQLAVYMPNTNKKREAPSPRAAIEQNAHNVHHLHDIQRRHGHGHGKKRRDAEKEERDTHPTIWVTATINGQVVSWINDYWGPSATPAPAPAPAPTPQNDIHAAAVVTPPAAAAAPKPAPTQAAPVVGAAVVPGASAGTGDFVRTGYYNAQQGKSQGLTFLGNYGGQGSGNWTT